MSAIGDCKKIIFKEEGQKDNLKNEIKIDIYELLGDIYTAVGNHIKAVENYKEALILTNMCPSFIKKYNDACKKIKGI
jgi:hypothetical protein